jgi:hypothetical protein
MLPWKNDKYQIVCPCTIVNGIHNPRALKALQITAITKQTTASQ